MSSSASSSSDSSASSSCSPRPPGAASASSAAPGDCWLFFFESQSSRTALTSSPTASPAVARWSASFSSRSASRSCGSSSICPPRRRRRAQASPWSSSAAARSDSARCSSFARRYSAFIARRSCVAVSSSCSASSARRFSSISRRSWSSRSSSVVGSSMSGALCGLQAFDLAGGREPLERLGLELADALRRQPHAAPGLAQRRRVVAVHAEAQLHDLALAVGQLVERAVERLRAQAHLDLLLGLRVVARHDVAERGLAVLADRLVEARAGAGGVADLLDLGHRHLGLGGDLLVGRRAAEPRVQLTLRARHLALALADVHRDPDRARLVRDAALDRLADPERRVGRELVAAAPVELLGRADQPEDALLDQVEQRQVVALVLLRERHDQAQVRVDHLILRLGVALLDALRELDLLLRAEQRVAADLVEEQLHRVGGVRREVVAADARRLDLLLAAVVGDVDVAAIELVLDLVERVLVELELLDGLAELGQVDAVGAALLGRLDEGADARMFGDRLGAHL